MYCNQIYAGTIAIAFDRQNHLFLMFLWKIGTDFKLKLKLFIISVNDMVKKHLSYFLLSVENPSLFELFLEANVNCY